MAWKTLPTFLFHDEVNTLLVMSKYVLDSLNLWPENQNLLSKIMHCYYTISYAFIIYGNVYFILTSNKIAETVSSVSILLVVLETVLRRIVLYVYRHRLQKLLRDIYFIFWPANLADPQLRKEIHKESVFLMFYCIVYSGSALLSTIIYIIAPIIHMNTPYKTRYPFNWRKNPYYSLLYAWQGICFLETLGTICGWDVFFAAICYNCVAQFKILKTYIKINFEKQKHDIVKQKVFIKKCIVHHYNILKICKELNDIFFYFHLTLFLVGIQASCISAFIMTVIPGQFFAGSSYFCGHLFQLFLYCYLGNELALQSTDLSLTLYMCGWENCDTDKDLRKSLVLIIKRSQKPVEISVGGFGYLNLPTFIKIMQFSFSVYTVLEKMVENDYI